MAEVFELAYIDYKDGMKYQEIADKYNVSLSTVKSWKSRKWEKDGKEIKVTKKVTKEHQKIEKLQRRLQIENGTAEIVDEVLDRNKDGSIKKPRSGNPNPSNGFKRHNTYGVKHGLYRKWLPPENVEIIEEARDMTIADRLWMQLELKFSNIIRMQKLLYVEDKEDHTSVVSGVGMSETYKVALSHEKYESYIKAENAATAEYRNIVKLFLEVAEETDERRLKLEAMTLGNEKLRAEIDKLNGGDKDKPIEIVIKKKEG